MRTPASTGPAICVIWFAAASTAFTDATARSSSPATSGMISRDEAKYGAAKQPIANVVTRIQPEREIARPLQDRQHHQQRPARGVGDEHRLLRAEPRDQRTGRDPEQGDRQPSPPRAPSPSSPGPGGDEDEPGQRDEGHRRAGERDELGGDEAEQGAVAPVHAADNKTSVRFCKVRPCRRSAASTRKRASGRSSRAPSAPSPARLRRRHGGEDRAGDRPLPRRDLQLLRRQAGLVHRARRST